MKKKYALFIVGERNSGKSTLIRSLTGCWKSKIYYVKSLSGNTLRAFVVLSSPQEMGASRYPPQNFPKCIEDKYQVDRKEYDILISPLELVVRNQRLYGYKPYIQSCLNQGFNVRLAVIETSWNNIRANPQELTNIQQYATQRNIPIILVNASNDPNAEASRIRQALYPS